MNANIEKALADALQVEAIDKRAWSVVQNGLPGALSDPEGIAAGSEQAIGKLIEGLMLGGFAMQATQSSRPASGAEHQFSHLWEMEHYGLDWDPPLSHGFKVGLGTVAVSALYEVVLSKDIASLIDVDAAVAAWPSWEQTEEMVKAALAPDLHEPALAQTKAKYVSPEELRTRLELTIAKWPTIEKRLRDQVLPAADLKAKLDAVGAVSHPSQIGMPMDRFQDTYYRARWIRTRFVLTDLLTQANLLEGFVDELFAPGGFWAE